MLSFLHTIRTSFVSPLWSRTLSFFLWLWSCIFFWTRKEQEPEVIFEAPSMTRPPPPVPESDHYHLQHHHPSHNPTVLISILGGCLVVLCSLAVSLPLYAYYQHKRVPPLQSTPTVKVKHTFPADQQDTKDAPPTYQEILSRQVQDVQPQHHPSQGRQPHPHPPHARQHPQDNPDRPPDYGYPLKSIGDSTEKMPHLFLMAPPVGSFIGRGVYKPYRIFAPCQAPSLLPGGKENDIHMTDHGGLEIKIPKDFVHRHRVLIRRIASSCRFVFTGLSTVDVGQGFSISLRDLLGTPLEQFEVVIDNKDRLNRTGVQYRHIYSKHLVVDNHQRNAMREVFQASKHADMAGQMALDVRPIVYGDSTKWVCDECHQHLLQKKLIRVEQLVSLKDFINLAMPIPKTEITLTSSASVILFTRTVENNPTLQDVTLHIKSDYFQDPGRRTGARFDAIKLQFDKLGEALQQARSLHRIQIHGDGQCGPVFNGLHRVLQCSSLKTLQVTGMSHFLKSEVRKTCQLERILLDGVHIDTDLAAIQLMKVLRMNYGLKHLRLSRSELSLDALKRMIQDDGVKATFTGLETLDISNNGFGAEIVRSLVSMALRDGTCLKHLDLRKLGGLDSRRRQTIQALLQSHRRVTVLLDRDSSTDMSEHKG